MQKIDEEKEKLSGRDNDPTKKKKGKKKKKKRKDDEKDGEKNKKSSLSNDQFIINQNYNLIKMLGFGAFGEIHLAYDTSAKCLRAIKFEIATHKNPQLKHEYSIIEQLNKSESNNIGEVKGTTGIPKAYFFDRMENKYNYMVMDFLGPSLSDLFQFKEKNFTLETVLMIGIQMLTRIEYIHEKGFLHRDIKPENFVIGLNEQSNLIYMIDYGLSKRYKDKNSNQHIPYRENRHLVGTVRYASINAHLGVEQSRRDDIESIGYVLAYFFLGRLPWQSKLDKGKPPVNKIMEKKLITPPEILCKKMPMEFSYYFHYCKNLKFEDRPDYTTLKNLFADLLISKISLEKEFIFDWFVDGEGNKKKELSENKGNDMLERSEKEERSDKEKDVTPGQPEENKKEPISMFGETKKGETDEEEDKKDEGQQLIKLESVGENNESVSGSDSDESENKKENVKEKSKKSSDYGIMGSDNAKSQQKSQQGDAVVDVKEEDKSVDDDEE